MPLEVGSDDGGQVWENGDGDAPLVNDMTASPHGGIVTYTPDIFEPEQLCEHSSPNSFNSSSL